MAGSPPRFLGRSLAGSGPGTSCSHRLGPQRTFGEDAGPSITGGQRGARCLRRTGVKLVSERLAYGLRGTRLVYGTVFPGRAWTRNTAKGLRLTAINQHRKLLSPLNNWTFRLVEPKVTSLSRGRGFEPVNAHK